MTHKSGAERKEATRGLHNNEEEWQAVPSAIGKRKEKKKRKEENRNTCLSQTSRMIPKWGAMIYGDLPAVGAGGQVVDNEAEEEGWVKGE